MEEVKNAVKEILATSEQMALLQHKELKELQEKNRKVQERIANALERLVAEFTYNPDNNTQTYQQTKANFTYSKHDQLCPHSEWVDHNPGTVMFYRECKFCEKVIYENATRSL
jgi:hypothetical protein